MKPADPTPIAPCPFCDSEAEPYAPGAGFVCCLNDGCRMFGPNAGDDAQAIAKWNALARDIALGRRYAADMAALLRIARGEESTRALDGVALDVKLAIRELREVKS